jgi:hypothetical protein
VGRRAFHERFEEYRAAVDALAEHAKALKNLHGDAFEEINERVRTAEIACDKARAALQAALLNDSGVPEP